MDIVTKITLVCSIIFMGYNASQLLLGNDEITEKTDEFIRLTKERKTGLAELRRTNFFLHLAMTIGYMLLIFFSELSLWIVVACGVKCCITLLISDVELKSVFKSIETSKSFFVVDKIDSILNVVFGVSVAVFLVL